MPPTPEDEGVARAFGEVRALLAQGPGVEAWQALCACLDDAGVDAARYAEQLEPYIQRALTAWPDRLRRASPRWLERASEDAPRDPLLALARRLEVRDAPPEDADLTTLAHDPLTRPITWLGARGFRGDGRALAALWGMPLLAGLEVLNATGLDLSRDGLPRLLAGATHHAPGLRALLLTHCRLESRALRALAVRTLPLRALDLSGHAFSRAELGAWLASSAIEGLDALGLRNLELWTPELRALAHNPHAATLERLDLWGAHVFSETINTLASAPHLSQLRHLTLGGTDQALGQGAELWRALLSLDPDAWPTLQTLELLHIPMRPEQLRVAGATWRGPRRLSARHNALSLRGVEALRQLMERGALPGVEVVDLRHNGLERWPQAAVVEALERWPAHMRVIAFDPSQRPPQHARAEASPEHARWLARDEDGDEWSL